MGSLIRFLTIVGATLVVAGCGLFEAVFAKPVIVPEAGCDRSVQEFYKTGVVTCGHITWQLHPRHARLAHGDVFGYFKKYDAMYAAIRGITGHEPPKPARILEQCPKGTPFWEDCPNGNLDLANPMFVRSQSPIQSVLEGLYNATPWIPTWTVYHPKYITVYVGREFFEAVLPRLVKDSRQPVYTSLGHEFGHVFGPSHETIYPYMWDRSFVESFASLWGVDMYLVHQHIAKVAQHYYSDGYCRGLHGFENWNCDTYFTFEEFANPKSDPEFDEFKKKKPRGRALQPYTGMLLTQLFRRFEREGRGEEYYNGLRSTLVYYHRWFRAPRHWEHTDVRSSQEATIREKISLFVYLLSVYSKTDLMEQFSEWGYEFSPNVQSWFMATRREGYADHAISRYVGMLAQERN